MLKPFFQGKLDTFCAIYAVLNALRLLYGVRVSKARDILNATLMSLAERPAAFRAVLNQQTDYVTLVDGLLASQKRQFPMEISPPLREDILPDEFWNICSDWLNGKSGQRSTIVLRFLRYATPTQDPVNRHWTTVDYLKDDILHLFDCSHEAEAILNVKRDSFVTNPKAVDLTHLLYIPPAQARFVRLSV